MHLAISDAAGCTLLLSGLITLVMLLREGCRRKTRSPFYILSTSDVLSSIVTAVALLASHIEAGIKLSYNWRNNTDSAWTIQDNGKHKLLVPRAREVDSNVTLTCDAKDMLMQYGMLLAPLTNAFVSLLTFAVQCNLNAACVKQRCADAKERIEVARRRGGTPEDRRELACQRSSVRNAGVARRIMKIFQFQTAKEGDKKPAGVLVASHWLVPFLVTVILCFAGYDDMNAARGTEDAECAFESNFPVSFHVLSDVGDHLIGVHTTSLGNYYPDDEEASNKSRPNIAEVNQIVSRVQSIVKNVLSHMRNSTEDMKVADFLDTSRLRNATDYIAINNTNRVGNVANVNRTGATQTTKDTTVEQTVSVHNLSSHANNDVYFDEDPEILLFHDSLKNASQELDETAVSSSSSVTQNDSYEENTHFAGAEEEEEEDATQRTVPIAQDTIFLSDGQIYVDMLKRIHAASAYTALKSQQNRSVDRSHGRKQPKRNDLENYIARMKPDSIENLFLRNDHFGRDVDDVKTSGSSYMINECLVSSGFLKLHLFVLSFAIYFLPILLCCILQVRGEHACETTLEILRVKADLISTLPRGDLNDDENVIVAHQGADTKWFPSGSIGSISHQNSTNGFDKPLEIRDSHISVTDVGTISKNDENFVEAQNRDVFFEVNCTARICRVVRMSLILCVLLWSPIFLGTLLRVFSCIRAPQWLTNAKFLIAISFGAVRNILNVYIIKIQELCNNDNVKENRVHPIE